MRIVFVCGSMERGRDGVGDFTRNLAEELIHRGHSIRILALNDKYAESSEVASQPIIQGNVQVLRLSGQLSSKQRAAESKTWIDEYNPDVISIQYVPFAYDKKGLPFSLGKSLKKLIGKRNSHIMFHELWVGEGTLKMQLMAAVQRMLIKNMFKSIGFNVTHTQLPLHIKKLATLGISAKPLALFSNIATCSGKPIKAEGIFKAGFFSQMNLSEDVIIFLKSLKQDVGLAGKKISVVFIGGAKDKAEQNVNALRHVLGPDAEIVATGFLDEEHVSKEIYSLDLGITPIPRHAIGKSGSVAAFFQHGIPVAAPVIDKIYKNENDYFVIPELTNMLVVEPTIACVSLIKGRTEYADLISIASVANVFLSDVNY